MGETPIPAARSPADTVGGGGGSGGQMVASDGICGKDIDL